MIFLRYHLRRLRKASAPDQNYKAAVRARLLASQQLVYLPARVSVFRYAFATAAFALVMFFSLGSYAYASSAVTEGTMLYPVKTSLENVEAGFQRTPEQQAKFRVKMMNRRMREVGYQLRHNHTPPKGLMKNVAKEMDLSVDEVRSLQGNDESRHYMKFELKRQIEGALNEMRLQVFQSDLSDAEKLQYFDTIDARLEKLKKIKTNIP